METPPFNNEITLHGTITDNGQAREGDGTDIHEHTAMIGMGVNRRGGETEEFSKKNAAIRTGNRVRMGGPKDSMDWY